MTVPLFGRSSILDGAWGDANGKVPRVQWMSVTIDAEINKYTCTSTQRRKEIEKLRLDLTASRKSAVLRYAAGSWLKRILGLFENPQQQR